MQPRLPGLERVLLLLLLLGAAGGAGDREMQRGHHHDDFAGRTFLFGKLVLVPVLAAIGLKFLALLPIVLSKIVLLSIMNFLSSNLNLLVSTLFGLKNFLGKHGLWPQEESIKHPAIETFAEWANQPYGEQPSFQYQYLLDQGNSFLAGTTKAPRVLKLVSSGGSYGSFVDPGAYKFAALDRRTRADDRRRFVKRKEPKSTAAGAGKYKCYWTSETEDVKSHFATSDNSAGKQEDFTSTRKFDVPDTSEIAANGFRSQVDSYAEVANEIAATTSSYALPKYYDYGFASPPPYHRQVATPGGVTEKSDGDAGIRDRQLPPFTADQVKVAENYALAAKFKADEMRGN